MTRALADRAPRRLLITVCPRERGFVTLPLERGGRRLRLDAHAVIGALEALVELRGLRDRVGVQAGCAGGCSGPGPNVSLAVYATAPPGERADHVALGWRTYVGRLSELDCLARVIDDNALARPIRSPRRRKQEQGRRGGRRG